MSLGEWATIAPRPYRRRPAVGEVKIDEFYLRPIPRFLSPQRTFISSLIPKTIMHELSNNP